MPLVYNTNPSPPPPPPPPTVSTPFRAQNVGGDGSIGTKLANEGHEYAQVTIAGQFNDRAELIRRIKATEARIWSLNTKVGPRFVVEVGFTIDLAGLL